MNCQVMSTISFRFYQLNLNTKILDNIFFLFMSFRSCFYSFDFLLNLLAKFRRKKTIIAYNSEVRSDQISR